MIRIWKYPFESTDLQTIVMLSSARVLSVDVQNGQPCMWVECDDQQPGEPRQFAVYGTGHPIAPKGRRQFLGTYQLEGGALIFHLYEVNF